MPVQTRVPIYLLLILIVNSSVLTLIANVPDMSSPIAGAKAAAKKDKAHGFLADEDKDAAEAVSPETAEISGMQTSQRIRMHSQQQTSAIRR